MIHKAADRFWLTVGVLLMAAVSVVGVSLAAVADTVAGRRREHWRQLDTWHHDARGDRLPIGDERRIRHDWLGQ